jgi:hypothetical protein
MKADPVVGIGGRKAPSSMGKTSAAEVLRLRATSPVSGDQSVGRFAPTASRGRQDDESVGELTSGDLCAGAGRTADPLAALQDDKGEGGDFY